MKTIHSLADLGAIRQGDLFRYSGHVYRARSDGYDGTNRNTGEAYVSMEAVRANPAMPSGWECADIAAYASHFPVVATADFPPAFYCILDGETLGFITLDNLFQPLAGARFSPLGGAFPLTPSCAVKPAVRADFDKYRVSPPPEMRAGTLSLDDMFAVAETEAKAASDADLAKDIAKGVRTPDGLLVALPADAPEVDEEPEGDTSCDGCGELFEAGELDGDLCVDCIALEEEGEEA